MEVRVIEWLNEFTFLNLLSIEHKSYLKGTMPLFTEGNIETETGMVENVEEMFWVNIDRKELF